jgi:TrmH family RNA methyltransferase
VALTARERRAKRTVLRPREAVAELTSQALSGNVAVVAGREAAGLTNEELDRCHALVTIPTNPDYRSLNLAQAVGVLCYESWLARTGGSPPLKGPRRRADAATLDQHERLFADWEATLWAIDFFKTRQHSQVMRSLREIIYRAQLDGREATLMRAMTLEVVRYLERRGVATESPDPPEDQT